MYAAVQDDSRHGAAKAVIEDPSRGSIYISAQILTVKPLLDLVTFVGMIAYLLTYVYDYRILKKTLEIIAQPAFTGSLYPVTSPVPVPLPVDTIANPDLWPTEVNFPLVRPDSRSRSQPTPAAQEVTRPKKVQKPRAAKKKSTVPALPA